MKRLVEGPAQLVGFGAKACSAGDDRAGVHRFCAFFRPAPGDAGRTELWALDVTAALAGDEVPCDGTNPRCLRLTDDLFTKSLIGSPSHPEAHRFDGDTLFFLAQPHPNSKALERYEGVVWAWRPGWERPRALTSDRGVTCIGGTSAAVAYCIDNAVESRGVLFDLRAGPLLDKEQSQLPLVERITALVDGDRAWSAAFAGNTLVFSSKREGEADETLRLIPADAIGRREPQTVVVRGTEWVLSADRRAVYFIRDRRREGGPGVLWTAPLDALVAPAQVATGVHSFRPLGSLVDDRGVAFITELRGLEGTLQVSPDRRAPDRVVVVARDVHFWYPSNDGRWSYILQSDRTGERGLIADNQKGSSCQLGRSDLNPVFWAEFVPRLGGVTFSQENPEAPDSRSLMVARPEDCGTIRTLGVGIDRIWPVGKRGLLVGASSLPRGLGLFWSPSFEAEIPPGFGEPLLDRVDEGNIAEVGANTNALLVGTTGEDARGPGIYLLGPF